MPLFLNTYESKLTSLVEHVSLDYSPTLQYVVEVTNPNSYPMVFGIEVDILDEYGAPTPSDEYGIQVGGNHTHHPKGPPIFPGVRDDWFTVRANDKETLGVAINAKLCGVQPCKLSARLEFENIVTMNGVKKYWRPLHDQVQLLDEGDSTFHQEQPPPGLTFEGWRVNNLSNEIWTVYSLCTRGSTNEPGFEPAQSTWLIGWQRVPVGGTQYPRGFNKDWTETHPYISTTCKHYFLQNDPNP